jgi:hypothetical protein
MHPKLKVVNHVVALLQEAYEVMEQIRNAPRSPITSFQPAKVRRVFRRNAKRLRRGSLQPRYPNVRSPDDLVTILERTADRDETIEFGFLKLKQILEEVTRVREYQAAEMEEGMRLAYQLAWQRAQEDGPESKAADFLRLFDEMIVRGNELRTLKRRDREADPPIEPFPLPGADPALELRDAIIAAEILGEPPDTGEPVLRFSSSAADTTAPPLILRIGLEEKAWVGTFQRGTTNCCTVQLMPDGAHLLVIACGAGYIVEAVTRSLAAQSGTDIMQVIIDRDAGFLFVDHAGAYLEGFGTGGRLWKTGRIGAGGIRNFELGDGELFGETRQGSSPDWIEFSVDLATGEVSWTDVAFDDGTGL